MVGNNKGKPKKRIFAIVNTRFEGIHYYAEASGDESFLKYPHRHVFHLKLTIEQFHDNRDIEFINFKRWMDKQIQQKNFEYKSCEMIATEVGEMIIKKYGKRELAVEVIEDGENGGVVTFVFDGDN